jgi:2-aminoadipate transaminase
VSPVRDLLALLDRPEVVILAGGLPAPELLDLDGVRTAFDSEFSTRAARQHLQYAPTEGNRDLRSLVAQRTAARGLPTSADHLLVTTGSQAALTLIEGMRRLGAALA